MSEMTKVLFGLIGGLALFLFGMNSMSDALQKAAGEKMKRILEFLTKNPVMGALAGALVTAVLQSSSATTVMVIGFVSAGLMSLPQAISVIFGANIGTTMTAQLMAFKISDYIYPIIFVGFLMNFVSKKEKVKNIGMVIFSFGLLFEGIEIMGSVMKPLAVHPIFTDLMAKVSELPALGILLGAGMTVVVQSSSATIAVLQNFASQAGPDGVSSVIGLAGAIPILLGDNIGTTITALLASIGQSKNAKRTAVAHSIFNISGSVVFACLIPVVAGIVRAISPKGNEVDVISRQIANAHTMFNLVCTLIWLPMIPMMVKIVTALVRGKDPMENEAFQPKFLDDNVLGQPVAAMYLVSEEIKHCAGLASSMLHQAPAMVSGTEPGTAFAQFQESCDTVGKLQEKITSYITRMFSSGALTETQSEQTAALLVAANNLERITARCSEIAAVMNRMREEGKTLSQEAATELNHCFELLQTLFEQSLEVVHTGDLETARRVMKKRNRMRKAQKQFNKAHLERVEQQICDASLTADFSGVLYNMDRIADNCVAIAEEALDHPVFVKLEEPQAAAAEEKM
ncbi:MAG: Na/Pi cotransporter family protein [Lachnospiraceae bacterium]|nr:Na/Pi cotransporter family protein [Lachnospiraceae bacterium]